MITSDPPDHDRMRRQAMRHFGPPHSPDLIPSMEAGVPAHRQRHARQGKGQKHGSTLSTTTPIRCRSR